MKKRLVKIANTIVEKEKQMSELFKEGKTEEVNKALEEMSEIAKGLTVEELLEIDEYIITKKLLTK